VSRTGRERQNGITADDYGYALEANDELQELLRQGRFRLVLKGHRHQPAIWRIGEMTLADIGALTEPAAPCAAIVDARAAR
jgi:predicted phosphodiesterase